MGMLSNLFNFENIGKKIKNFTKWSCWISILLTWIAAIVLFVYTLADGLEEYCWIPIVAALILPFFIWIGSWTLYAFGELVDKAIDIDRNTRGGERKPEAQAKADSDRISKIEKLRSQGLITEEEYQQAISKKQ